MSPEEIRPQAATEEAEEQDAHVAHIADRMPTPDEEAAAERSELAPSVAESHKEAIERGAEIKGEGEIR